MKKSAKTIPVFLTEDDKFDFLVDGHSALTVHSKTQDLFPKFKKKHFSTIDTYPDATLLKMAITILEDEAVYKKYPADWQTYHYVTPEVFQNG
jgi:hypothetical protein